MPRLTYTSVAFPPHLGTDFRGTNTIDVSWPEIVWAALSVGKAEVAHLLRYGMYSLYELAYRAAIVYANLRETAGGQIECTSAFRALDPSEKGAISYFLGLTTAKLLASRLLHVPWLMHLDVYRGRLQPIRLAGSKVKPDLVGLNSRRDWIVIEAKGRSGPRDSRVVGQAKSQTRCLRRVAGALPVLRIAHVAYFRKDELRTHWVDPDEYDDNASDVEITREEFLTTYYAPLRAALNDARVEEREDGLFRIRTIPELDVRLGLRVDVDIATRLGAELPVNAGDDRAGFVGSDGILIELGASWSEDRMRRDPSGPPG